MDLINELLTKEFAFGLVKPDSFKDRLKITTHTQGNGFEIPLMKHVRFNIVQARMFYNVHEGKPFFDELTKHISSGPVLAMLLRRYGTDAIEEFRKLLGHTNPEKAEIGTLRNVYGKSITENAVHGTDCLENLKKEVPFIWSIHELVGFL